MSGIVNASQVQRQGRWLPDQHSLEAWLAGLCQQVGEPEGRSYRHVVIREFQELIDRDPIVRMNLTRMIEQVPHTKPYSKRHLQSLDQMLHLIDEVIGRAPEYNETGLVGCPINAILDWCMGTPAGFAAFRMDAVNAMLRRILNAWCEFLESPASCAVLNDSPAGWMCPAAIQSTNLHQSVGDPAQEHWGFRSWNDFFTRRLRPGQRPIAAPDDDKVIISACESTPYAIKTDVQRQDDFWIKAQPYSLDDMLAHDEAVAEFVGGTVYQAFLDAHNYHRWHSPVSGTVRKAFLVAGTYYSEADSEGEDPEGPKKSQGYLAHVATRAIILIEANDPLIGLIGFIAIGMVEVSSCVFDPAIRPGARIQKGDELGYFQFGGSSHCLLFRPGVVANFALGAIPVEDNPDGPLMLVKTHLATAH